MEWILTLLTIFVFVFVFVYTKSLIYVWYSAFYFLSYFVDMLVTKDRGALFFSPTISYYPVGFNAYFDAALFAFITFFLFSLMFSFFWFIQRTKVKVGNGISEIKLNRFSTPVLFLFVIGLLFVFGNVVLSDDLSMLLSNRQLFFSNNIVASLMLYMMPAALIILVFEYKNTKFPHEKIVYILGGLLVFIFILLTGSRSALILNSILPCVYLFYLRPDHVREKKSNIKSRVIVFFAIIGFLMVFAGIYRDITRGEQASEGFFVSPDFVQFDSLALIIDEDLKGESTYSSLVTAFIPRFIWENKPVSGNSYVSKQLFSDRVEQTGAEITSSLLGEGYINFGWGGVVSSAFILFAVVVLCSILMKSDGLGYVFGAVLVFRGINIIRGDLLNTFLPLFFTFVFFYILLNKHKE